jgi:hypothetical protein
MERCASNLKIGVDLDGTISEYPEFFKVLTKAMADAGCRVYVITNRLPGSETQVAQELAGDEITYHVIKITGRKANYILNEGIGVLFDDQDEYFVDLPKEVAVFKVRQKYNFDFVDKVWRDVEW